MWMWRKCVLYALTLIVCGPAQALTLGNFEVQTRALAAFRGEIELYNVYETDYRKIDVRITPVSPDQEERLGDTFWDTLGVGVSMSSGLAWVSVYSQEPLRVGVEVLVQVRWPEGQVERIYNISPIGVEKPQIKKPCRASGDFIYCR